MFLNCGAVEDSWESLGLEEIKPVNPKGTGIQESVLNIHWKDWYWSWSSNTLATWCEELTHRKRPWCWERLKTGGEGHDRGWDGLMASPTQRTWVWASSRSWWWTGKPGVLQTMGLQRHVFDPWVGKIHWRRAWQPTPVFLPGESHGQRSLAGSQSVGYDWVTNTR